MSHEHHDEKRKVVVLSINNRTNHVFRSISSRHAPKFEPGTLARVAFFDLLEDGFSQVAELEGDTWTVVGFVKQAHHHTGEMTLTAEGLDLDL